MTMYLNSDEATLHYNYTNQSGEIISYGKYIDLTKPVVMIDNGTVSAPIRPMFNYFGLWIEWNEETATAIEEGKRIMQDSTIPQYSNIDELRSAL